MPSVSHAPYFIFMKTLCNSHHYLHYKWKRFWERKYLSHKATERIADFGSKADNVFFPLQNMQQGFNSILNQKGIHGYDSMFTEKW